jgi:predicted permease
LVGQVAMVTALLFAAGLLVRSYGHLDGLDPGFDPEGIMTVQLSLDDARFSDSETVLRLFDETLAGIRRLPGVTSAAVTLTLPYERPLNLPFRLPWFGPEDRQVTNAVYVTPQFFETLGIPVLRGRALEEADRQGAPWVAVVNQAFLDANMEGHEAIGTSVTMNFVGEGGAEIVGIVGNVQQVAGFGGNSQPVSETPTLYLAASQVPGEFFRGIHVWFAPSWIIKASGGQVDLPIDVMRTISEVNPDLPMARTASLSQVMDRAFSRQRFEAAFLLVVSSLSLLLAGIGLYGIVAHEVLERRAEMGLRMALGATPGNAVWVAGFGGVRLTIMGLVLGCGLAVVAARFTSHLVWGVSAFDPVILVSLLAILGSLATIASFVPAARVGRLDPATILREG